MVARVTEIRPIVRRIALLESQLACDVRGDVAHPAVGSVEGHHAQRIQHQNPNVPGEFLIRV